jgi:ATP-dependent Clp protease ATP-binding subunit ClpA
MIVAKALGGARGVARQAERVALRRRSCTVRAEHLLIAACEAPTPSLAAVLERHGLNADDIADGIDLERAAALLAAGVSVDDYDLGGRAPSFTRPRWESSAREALERAVQLAARRRDRRVTADHVVLGVLQPNRGTVPRALARLEVDRHDLRAAVDSGLDAAPA